MPLITDNPEEFFNELNKPKEEKPSVVAVQEKPVVSEKPAKEASITEDPAAFFSQLEKPVEEHKPETPQSVFLGQIQGKKPDQLETFDIQSLNQLAPDELHDVAMARKDLPLTDEQLRSVYDYHKTKAVTDPNYGTPSSIREFMDYTNRLVDPIGKIGTEVAHTLWSAAKGAGKLAYRTADYASTPDMDIPETRQYYTPEQQAEFRKLKAEKGKIAEAAWQSAAEPIIGMPEELTWLGTKLGAGGFDWYDRASEALGLQDHEKSFQHFKARRAIDSAQAQYYMEHQSAYGRLLDLPVVKGGLEAIVKSQMPSTAEWMASHPDISKEQAQAQLDSIAKAHVENQIKESESRLAETDPDIATFTTFAAPEGLGMGTMGALGMGARVAGEITPRITQGLKYLGKTDAEINAMNAAEQALNRAQQEAKLAKTAQPSMFEKGAGKLAEGIDWTSAKIKGLAEKIPQQIRPFVPYVAAGTAGGIYGHQEGRSVIGDVLHGIEVAGLLKAPALARDIAEARRISAGGTKGTFETMAGFPNVSEGAAKVLRFGGKNVDTLIDNATEYAKAGIHGTAIAVATGALESADPETMNELVSNGLIYTLGGHAFNRIKGKITGVDPVLERRKRAQQDVDNLKTYADLSPETKQTLDNITDWSNVVQSEQQKTTEAFTAYQDASARVAKNTEELGKEYQAQQKALSSVMRANVQTRNEYGRLFIDQISRNNQLVNGSLRAGQNNVGINILTTKQIFDQFRKDPANAGKSDADIMEAANQRGFYSTPEGAIEYRHGIGMEAPKKDIVFDRTKPSVVVNADHLKARSLMFGESLIDTLNHEIGHHVSNIPEFRDANKDAEAMLFSQEIKDPSGNVVTLTSGRYSPKELVEMYTKNYMKNKSAKQIEDLSKLAGLWDYSRQALDENAVASYMRDEILADLNAGTISRHLGKDLDSGTQHLLDVARLKTKKNLLDKAIQKFAGLGGKGEATSELTGAKFSPEVLAANRQAMRALQSLQGEVSPAVAAPETPKISRAEMMKNRALQNRYGKDSGMFKTKVQAQIFDGNGNPVGAPIDIANPNAAEGTWQNKDGQIRQSSGYGQRPDEVSEVNGVQIPEGGSLVVGKQIVTQPDGVTPVLLTPKEAKQLQKDRGKVVRDALNTPDEGAPNRFEPTGDPDGTWRGMLTPLQIEAIKNLPESIVPKSIKERILSINDWIKRGDGSRMLVDYAAVMNDNGKYTPYSAKIYDVVPIGMHLSKDGHFLVTTISVGRMFDKLNKWSERMPARLSPWNGSKEAFFKEFTETYLQNWQNGLAGETGLAGTPAEAIAKKNIFNDFLNLATKDTAPLNPDRIKTPRRRGDVRGKDIDRTIMSMRLDHMAELIDNDGAPKVPVSYQKAKFNMMPAEEPAAPREEERKPSAIDLGITAAHSKEAKPFGISYVGKGEQPAMAPTEKYPTSEQGFYSGLQKTIDEKMPAKASPQQILSIVNNPQNAKPEEVKWSNLAGFLEGKQSVTKQEVLDYLKNEGSVKFEEKVLGARPDEVLSGKDTERLAYLEKENAKAPLGAMDDRLGSGTFQELLRLQNIRDKSTADTLYAKQEELEKQARQAQRVGNKSRADALWKEANHMTARVEALEINDAGIENRPQYQRPDLVLPNGENYREVVLTMPTGRTGEIEFGGLTHQITMEGENKYTSSHFPNIPNYVAHMRLDERKDATGKDGLFIEEIQSDRHQAGREKGYRGEEKYKELPDGYTIKSEKEPDQGTDTGNVIRYWVEDPDGKQITSKSYSKSSAESEAINSLNDKVRGTSASSVPDAPFRKDWSVQMFKRALRDAVASGKEWIGWTSGDTQAERYDLSKQVRDISYRQNDGELQARGINGGRAISKSGVTPDKLESFVGKEVAKKLLEEPTGQHFSKADGMGMGWHTLSGQDLKVGGEGMKGFYDQILPKEIGKYVKKWGAKVEEGEISQSMSKEDMDMGDVSDATPEELAQLEAQGMVSGPSVKIWKVAITPEMRESIQKGGQLQFMPSREEKPENTRTITRQYGDYSKGTKVVIVGQKSKDPLDTNIRVQFPDGKVEKFPIDWLKSPASQGEKTNLPKLVKDRGRDAVNILIGEWDQNAQLNQDGTGIVSAVDPRQSMKKTKVPTSDFTEWLKGQDVEAILAAQGEEQQPQTEPERITEATYTNPRTGKVSRGATHLIANPNAPQEATDRESPAYGFGTTSGRIVDRKEGYQIAKAAGQLKEPATEEEKFHADRGVLHSGMYEPIQRISSAGTSIRQVPAVFKAIPWKKGTLNADIGGGKYDEFTNALQTQGVENVIYDPYNRSTEHNQAAMGRIAGSADTATISNVLNVIAEPAAREQVIRQAAEAIKPDGEAYFSVYEGDKSGKGKETPRGYQLNRKLADYISEIEKHFGSVTKKGNILIAKEPVKAGASDIAFMPSSKLDGAHASAIEMGDTEEAQRLVDEAAKKAGYDPNQKWYHGTLKDNWTIPEGVRGVAAHITKNIDEAYNFADTRTDETGDPSEIRTWVLKNGELFDPTDESHVERVQKVLNDLGIAGEDAQYHPESWKNKIWTTLETPVAQKAIKDAGFIGYLDRESPYDEWGDNAAIFEPNSLKEISAITLDDNNDLIPLSQRFNQQNNDIRFMPSAKLDEAHADLEKRYKQGDEKAYEEAQRLSDEKARKAGAIKAWHGTDADFIDYDMDRAGSNTGGFLPIKGIFFSKDKNHSSHLAEGEENKHRKQAYIVFHNPFIGKNWEDLGKHLGGDITDWDDGKGDRGLERLKQLGNDGYILANGDEILVTNASQIKSADPFTYNDEGKLIPLSQRFNKQSNDIRFMPSSKLDEAHAKAIESGDTEEAQRLVDEAAKEAGYDFDGYHGTKENFNVFRKGKDGLLGKGIYMAVSPSEAKGYSLIKRVPNEEEKYGPVFKLKAKIDNPYVISSMDGFDKYLKDAYKWLSEQDSEDLSTTDYLKSQGYDGIIDHTGGEKGHIVAFDKEQVKLSDPATYDDNGKLIPLSQRFNQQSNDIRFMPKSEEPDITEDGHVMPKTMDKPFAFTPQIAINFMPATPQVDLENYLDRPIIALAADRMGIGQAYVGPTGAKQALSMPSQGGAGFSTLYRDDEHNPIWAFSKEQPALNFLKRINDVAEQYGVDSVLVAPTLLAPDNHLKNQTGQLGYVEAMEAAMKAKMIKPSALNAQINEIIKRIAESESPKAKQATKKLEGISTFKEFADAVRKQSFNFADAEWIMKKAAQKKLPITAKELDQMGLLPSNIARDLAHEGFYELPNFSVVSLFEVPKGQKPEKGMYHNAYPYIVRGKSIGYLKNIINLAEATKEPKVFTKSGQITAQPLMTVMPIIDQVLAKKALDTLKAYTPSSN